MGICKVEGCGQPMHARRLCRAHYMDDYNDRSRERRRAWRNATPLERALQRYKSLKRMYKSAVTVKARVIWKERLDAAKAEYEDLRDGRQMDRAEHICEICGQQYRRAEKIAGVDVCSMACNRRRVEMLAAERKLDLCRKAK